MPQTDDMRHRSTDDETVPADLSIKVQRSLTISVEWVIGGLASAAVICGGWALSSTLSQRDTARDVAQIKNDISDIKSSSKSQLDESTKAAMSNVELKGRISALEGRLNILESARSATRP